MKVLILFLSFSFSISYAAEVRPALDPETTAHGNPMMSFCETGAKKRIQELNLESLKEVEKAKPLQKEINSLLAKRNLIKSFLDLRNDFKSSLQKITNGDDKKPISLVDDFKRLLKSSMIFEALMATKQLEKNAESEDIVAICNSLEAENKQTAFCNYMNSIKIKVLFDSEVSGINATLKKYNEAKSHLEKSDKKVVEDQLQIIYDTIPQSINPESVLATILDKAPDLAKAMGSEKTDIEDCFKDKPEACTHLLTEHKDKVKDLMQSQLSDVHKAFSVSKLEAMIDKVDQVKKLGKEKLAQALKLAKDQNATLNGVGLSEATIQNFAETCSKEDPDSREKCKEYTEELVKFFEDKTKNLNEEIAKKTEALNALDSTSGELAKIEKMKHYVAQKYIRKCYNADERQVATNLSKCLLGADFLQAAPAASPEVASLNKKLSDIISKIHSDNSVSSTRGELGPFSKNELETYLSYCRNANLKNYSDICTDVQKEANAIKNVKESKEWEEYSNKYWIVPNDKNKKGYDVFEKKSNTRIFGEALAQSSGRILPMWMGNMALKYQIGTLETQGLYLKQMNYTYSSTSPWAMGFPYFQGNYYTYPATTNLSNPFSTSAGFNFSK